MDYFRKSITKFSMTITKHLFSKKEYKETNIVFSPLSLQTALSPLAAGSEGPTQHQLLSFLESKSIGHLSSLSSHLISSVLKDAAPAARPRNAVWVQKILSLFYKDTAPPAAGPRMSFVNAVWVDKTLSLYPSFKETVATDYKATIESLDFINKANEAIETVNIWAKKETNGLIRDFLPPNWINSSTRLILTNALYFKGAWDQQFNAWKTKKYDFHLIKGSSVKVPFMTSKKRQFIRAFEGFKVLRLPYNQGEDKRQFSMYFFLPNAKDGLLPLIEKVASESEFLEHKLPYTKVEVGDFRIPRFNISFGLEISDVLKELGLVLPFSNGGLTKIADSPTPIQVSKVLQKSFIEVNEEGTEAAAVTAVGMMVGSCRRTSTPIPIDFVADHPFLFLIREDLSGTILFVGQVHNPLVG